MIVIVIIIIVYLNDLSNRPVDPIIKIGFGVENMINHKPFTHVKALYDTL